MFYYDDLDWKQLPMKNYVRHESFVSLLIMVSQVNFINTILRIQKKEKKTKEAGCRMCFKTTTVLIYRMNISSTVCSIELRVHFGIGQWS